MDPLTRLKKSLEERQNQSISSCMGCGSGRSHSTSAHQTISHGRSIDNQSSRRKNKKTDHSGRSRTIDPILNTTAYRSLKILNQTKCNHLIATIKNSCYNALNQKTRDSKLKLCDTLIKLHQFFKKIQPKIVQSLSLLGKITMYYRGQIIHQTEQTDEPCRTCNDLGFLLYGKVELVNEKQFYSKISHNFETLFEHRMIRMEQKYEYKCRVIEESMVLWVSKEVYYLIRRQCFLNMDLKYMFHQFQNHLKYYLIHKNLQKLQ